jgi:hypothetical protein
MGALGSKVGELRYGDNNKKLKKKLGRAAEKFPGEVIWANKDALLFPFSVSTWFGLYGESPPGGSSSSFHFFSAFAGFSSYTSHSSCLKNPGSLR